MNDATVPVAASNEPLKSARFYPWRDPRGREHPAIPRCMGFTKPRGFLKYGGDCRRRGVVQRGMYNEREAWFCLQHDPSRRDEKRVAELAPALLDLVRDALGLVPRTGKSGAWRSRAEATVAKAENRRGSSLGEGGGS